jgi:hypothetical protein
MKKNFFVIALVFVLSTASCGMFPPSDEAIQTAIALTRAALPTNSPNPPSVTSTFTPAPTPTPTLTPITPTPTLSMYFVEEFDTDPGAAWELELSGPKSYDVAKLKMDVNDGRMVFNIDGRDMYAYYLFKRLTYTDVRIDLRAENRGVNSNIISLVCRRSGKDWYEFVVRSSGSWFLYAHNDVGYYLLARGGALALKLGKETNEYTMTCKDDYLSMFVNDIELKGSPFHETTYKFREGFVGFNIASTNIIPVKVEVDWFQISEP